MRFISATASAVLAATALAAPPPSLMAVRSIADAVAQGVDVFGPIPSDAVRQPQGHYSAKEGSQAWHWIRAQIDIPRGAHPNDTLAKRDAPHGFSGMGIGMFSKHWCLGDSHWTDNAQYGLDTVITNGLSVSVGISYRGLQSNEQLDFSRRSPSDLVGSDGKEWNSDGTEVYGDGACDEYLYSAGKNTPSKPQAQCILGCFNSQPYQCFQLWRPGVDPVMVLPKQH